MADLVAWDGASVARMIEERRFDEAAARVEEVLSPNPAHLPAKLAKLRLLVARGETEEALALSAALLTRRGDNKWVVAGRVEALVAAGRIADAREAFLALPPPQPGDAAFLGALVNTLLAAEPDPAARIDLLGRALAAWGEDQVLLLRLASQTFLLARAAEAEAYLDRAEALGPLPRHARQLRESLVATSGNHRAAARYLVARADESPDDAGTARRLVRTLAAAGRFADAAERMAAAIARWPRDWLVLYRLNRTFLDAGQDAAILDALRRAEPPDDLWRLQFALFALRTGNVAEARAGLAAAAASTATQHIAGPTLAALDGALRLAVRAPRVGVDTARDVEVVRVDDAAATVVVFGTLTGGVGHLPFAAVDPLLARLPVNVVYLRDRRGLAFLRGVASLGADEAASVRALAAIVHELGAPRVVTLGSSVAGYAATRYGLALGADATLSFAGPVALDGDTGIAGPGGRPTALGMEELRAVAGGAGDLSGAIAAAGERFALTVVVGSDYAPDLRRTEKVAALPNVSVVVLPAVDHHFTAHEAIADGRFLPLLERLVLPPPPHDAR